MKRKRGTTRDMMVAPITAATTIDGQPVLMTADGIYTTEALAVRFGKPLPLIRCTQPTPCGHCWYCNEHAKVAQ